MTFAIWLFAGIVFLASPQPGVAQCRCDCDADGRVTVAELVRVVNIALGNAPVSSCDNLPPPCLACPVGSVSIDGMVGCVNDALHGCPSPQPTPSLRGSAQDLNDLRWSDQAVVDPGLRPRIN